MGGGSTGTSTNVPAPRRVDGRLHRRRETGGGGRRLELLQRVEEPDPLWSLLACLAFLGWIGGGFGFVFRGLDEELHIQRRPATIWAAVTAGSIALWVVALLLA